MGIVTIRGTGTTGETQEVAMRVTDLRRRPVATAVALIGERACVAVPATANSRQEKVNLLF